MEKTITIKVDCPDGYKPVFNESTQRVEFVEEFSVKKIDSISTALGLLDSEDKARLQRQKDCLFELITIIKALNRHFNNGNEISLVKNDVYYPYLKFYTKEKTNSIRFKYDNEIYYLVGGDVSDGSSAGVGCFSSGNSVGYSHADVGLLGCATEEIAEYVSKTFPKLIFDALYWGKIDYEWID